MNKENILKIADYIENVDPDQFNMSAWFGELVPKELNEGLDVDEDIQLVDGFDLWDYDHIHHFIDGFSTNRLECGTAACIAGWTNVYMFKYTSDYDDVLSQHSVDHNILGATAVETTAAEYFGLTPAESYWIFYTNEQSVWHQYREEYGFKNTRATLMGNGINISNKDAADVLRRIANGDIVYPGEINV